MDKQKQKRMIYIYEENLEFYESLANKSQLINEALTQARLKTPKTDNNIEYVRQRIAEIDKGSKPS